MAVPAAYLGEVSECQGFLMQCQLYFGVLPHKFSGDCAKIAFIISLLSRVTVDLVKSSNANH